MKTNILVSVSLVLLTLAACSSKPLSETECRELIQKEIDFAISKAPPDEADSMRSFLSDSIEGGVARCVTGKTYNRSDYKCMVSAKSPAEIGVCIQEALKHIRR